MSVARLETSKSGDGAALPSWFFSLVLHGLIAMLLIASAPAIRSGGASETSRRVGLVVVQGDPQGAGDGDDEASDTAELQPVIAPPMDRAPAPESLIAEDPPRDNANPVVQQPASEPGGTAPTNSETDADIDSLTEITERLRSDVDERSGNTVPVRDALGRGKGRTQVFGLPGEGYKFVYVFDRSASMGGSGRSTLSAAKAELLKSLASLGETHQFQIIFYNEEPAILNIAGRSRLVFGTQQNKELARRFVGGITADGATRHEDAILMALRLKPDVIFFLTDADEPALSDAQLKRIHQIAEGATAINTIEFGSGPLVGGENFLARLAHQNAGKYAYFDVTELKNGK
jgi:hypothetical protein